MRPVWILVFAVACTDDTSSRDPGPQGPKPVECPGELEHCGVRDGGWDVFCAEGIVEIQDLTQAIYCTPDGEIACYSEIQPRMVVLQCANGCSQAQKYLETIDELHRFDPTTMCR